MGKKKVESFCFILKLIIFLQLYGNFKSPVEGKEIEFGTAVAKFQNQDGISLKARMIQIEMKSRQQDNEISNLKTKAEEDRNAINRLEGLVSMLEAAVVNSKPKADGNYRRQKRPFRLLPPHQPNIGAIDKESDEKFASNSPFYGPPTSCSDLGKIGYTLNGYYLVKRNDNSNISKIATVFCSFKQQKIDRSLETFIGFLEIKTKSVDFFVQRSTALTKNFGKPIIIPFEIEKLNVGGALNMTTGVFTAPVAGIYHFQFSGRKDDSIDYLEVSLELNGGRISYTSAGVWGGLNNKESINLNAIHVSLRLKRGDRVHVSKKGAALYDFPWYPFTYFSGSLLEEDLELA